MPAPTHESDRQLQLFGDSAPLDEQRPEPRPFASSPPRPELRLVVGMKSPGSSYDIHRTLAVEPLTSIEERLLKRVQYF